MAAIACLTNLRWEWLLAVMGGMQEVILITEVAPEDFDFDENLNNES